MGDWVRNEIHPIKPGYIAFLALARQIVPLGEERSIVLVQSVLLFASIICSALIVARSIGWAQGLTVLLVLALMFRLRDSASALMSESLAAALAVPLMVAGLIAPRAKHTPPLVGLGLGLLFLIRPNVGFVTAVLVLIGWWRPRHGRQAGVVAMVVALALIAPVWWATRPEPADDSSRGLSLAVLMGSTDYYWNPATVLGLRDSRQTGACELAIERWRALLGRWNSVDVRRQLLWRALHGLFGTEFYDARWSPSYQLLDTWSRAATPIFVLLAVSVLVVGCFGPSRRQSLIGLTLAVAIILQSLLIGALPRFALPMLPGVFLAAISVVRPTRRFLTATAAIFGASAFVLWSERQVLDWEWGLVESSGVVLAQQIPKGSLEAPPATCHVRIGTVLVGSVGVVVYDGSGLPITQPIVIDPAEPVLSFPVSETLWKANISAPVSMRIESVGQFDAFHYLRFPVIPPLWGARAFRIGSRRLSPDTGVMAGSLDWWSHSGVDDVSESEPTRFAHELADLTRGGVGPRPY